MTKTANRNTVTTTVVSPIPITAIRIGTSAEIGALMKILTHRPRILPRLATLAMRTPIGMPTSSASAMPSAKERKRDRHRRAEFRRRDDRNSRGDHTGKRRHDGRQLGPADDLPDDEPRPTVRKGSEFVLPNRIISVHEPMHWKAGSKLQADECPREEPAGNVHCSSTSGPATTENEVWRRKLCPLHIVLQDLPYLVHGIEIVFVPADLVGIFSVAVDVGLDDLRYCSRPRR